MKLFTILASLLISLSAQAQWTNILSEIAEESGADYLAETGKPLSPLAFYLQKSEDEFSSRVFFTEESKLWGYDYHCHAHEDHFHCAKENQTDLGTFTPASTTFKAEEFVSALDSALDLFSKKVSTPDSIQSVKIWANQAELFLTFQYLKDNAQRPSYMMCHYHDSEGMDCHRKSSSGPNEPGKE